MKELKRYLGATYSDICQTVIMTKMPAAFPNPDIMTIVMYNGYEHPNNESKKTYL